MHQGAVRRLELETELRKSLELGEFRTHYQPIVSLRTGRITGFEALTRWQRGDRLLAPAEFIAVADETGLIIPMNRLLLREACEQPRAWHVQFPADPPLRMSINITSKEFAHQPGGRDWGDPEADRARSQQSAGGDYRDHRHGRSGQGSFCALRTQVPRCASERGRFRHGILIA